MSKYGSQGLDRDPMEGRPACDFQQDGHRCLLAAVVGYTHPDSGEQVVRCNRHAHDDALDALALEGHPTSARRQMNR